MRRLHKIGKVLKISVIISGVSMICLLFGITEGKAAPTGNYLSEKESYHSNYETGSQELDFKSSILVSIGLGASLSMIRIGRKKV